MFNQHCFYVRKPQKVSIIVITPNESTQNKAEWEGVVAAYISILKDYLWGTTRIGDWSSTVCSYVQLSIMIKKSKFMVSGNTKESNGN